MQSWQIIVIETSLVLSVGFALLIGYYTLKRRSNRSAIPFAALMVALAIWCGSFALELADTSLSGKVFWASVKYIGIVAVPLTWFIFALEYTAPDRFLTRRRLALLLVEPIITLVLLWLNPADNLIRTQVRLNPVNLFSEIEYVRGPWFWLNAAYSNILLVSAMIALLISFLRSSHVYRRQAGTILISGFLPFATTLLYVLGISPISGIHLTPVIFVIPGILVFRALFRYKFLDLVPIARDAIIASMEDGMVVLDRQARVVDLNPAARQILNHSSDQALGKPIANVFAQSNLFTDWSAPAGRPAEFVLGAGEHERTYELRTHPLNSRDDRAIGQLLLMREITDRKTLERGIADRSAILAQQHRRQAALAQIGLAMNQAQKLEEVLQCAVKATSELLPATAGSTVVLWEDKAEKFGIAASTIPGFPDSVFGNSIRKDGATRWVVDNRESMIIPDAFGSAFQTNPALLQAGVRAYAMVPLLAHGEVLGVLNAHDLMPRQYVNDEIDFLKEIANHASAAIVRANLFAQIEMLATTDELTGAANRRQLFALGEREVIRCHRLGRPLSVLMFDLDQFKHLNDTFGHLTGDQVLRSVADVVQENIREIDVLGRYGGEEFIVLLPETELPAACEMAERIRTTIAARPVVFENVHHRVTISIGVAQANAQTRELSDLIHAADRALYKAKQAGRNRIFFADNSLARQFYLDHHGYGLSIPAPGQCD